MNAVMQTELAREGLRGALEARRKAGVTKADPVCVYDLASKLGLQVRFVSGKSFGGMYSKTSNAILVPSLRPPGRRAMTCAHEIGHSFYGHGSRIEIQSEEDLLDDTHEDRLANLFGHHLLMPVWAVRSEFERRNLVPANCGPVEIYQVANQLGVAYEALVRHLHHTCHAIDHDVTKQLLAMPPKHIRFELLGTPDSKHLVVADAAWHTVPIDLEVDDFAIVPKGSCLVGKSVQRAGECQSGVVLQAIAPGLSNVSVEESRWGVFIRVSRLGFTGLSIYRHLEEADDERPTSAD